MEIATESEHLTALAGRTAAHRRHAPAREAPAAEPPLSVIEGGGRSWLPDLRELWRYRDLFGFLTWRDVAVRYKQTVLGVLWAVLQPFLTMIVFTVFFGRLAGLDKGTGAIPYPVFVYAGLLPWMLFAQSVARGSQSLVASERLITKVYFPRILIPSAAVAACVVDFAVASLLLAAMMLWHGIAPTIALLTAPALLALTLSVALGMAMLVGALNVTYRDFRYVVPFMMQLWMLATPAIYAKGLLPARWEWVAAVNPLTGIIGGWRSCILGDAFDWAGLGLSAAVTALLFLVGCAYFRRAEQGFADII